MRPPPGSTGSHSPPGGGCRAASWHRPDPRRSARPTPLSLAAITALVLPPVLAELTAARADGIDARAVISSPALGGRHRRRQDTLAVHIAE